MTAAVLGLLLASSMASAGPLDDPDPAMQRAGMLDVVGPRSAAPTFGRGVPAPGRRSVVFFVRPAQLGALISALAEPDGTRLAAAATLSVIVAGAGVGSSEPAPDSVTVIADPDGGLAVPSRMGRPRDGGPPVGYVVIGPDGTVRFRTEDPGVANRLDEVLTMVDALP